MDGTERTERADGRTERKKMDGTDGRNGTERTERLFRILSRVFVSELNLITDKGDTKVGSPWKGLTVSRSTWQRFSKRILRLLPLSGGLGGRPTSGVGAAWAANFLNNFLERPKMGHTRTPSKKNWIPRPYKNGMNPWKVGYPWKVLTASRSTWQQFFLQKFCGCCRPAAASTVGRLAVRGWRQPQNFKIIFWGVPTVGPPKWTPRRPCQKRIGPHVDPVKRLFPSVDPKNYF